MPGGDGTGTGVALGTVGPKATVPAGSGIGRPASAPLLARERNDERNPTIPSAAKTTTMAVQIKTGGMGTEEARAAWVVLRVF